MKKRNFKKGFTITELLVTLLIAAILLAIAIPSYIAIKNNAEKQAHNTNVQQIESLAMLYLEEHPDTKSITVKDLVANGYLKKEVKVPKSIGKEESDYTITINSDGSIRVIPEAVK